jgi:hypothetical protein
MQFQDLKIHKYSIENISIRDKSPTKHARMCEGKNGSVRGDKKKDKEINLNII